MIRAEIFLPDGEMELGKLLEAMKRFHQAYHPEFETTAWIEQDPNSELKSIVLFAERAQAPLTEGRAL